MAAPPAHVTRSPDLIAASDRESNFRAHGIACQAWDRDRAHVAVCPGTNEVHIYAVDGASSSSPKFTKLHTLAEHEQLVSAVDWSHEKNLVVTCAHDRNAYVWRHTGDGGPSAVAGGKWEPQMTLLPAHMNRAALCVQWSPREDKFALGSGSKSVSVCYYEQENDWWISKVIRKKHASSVTCVAWHANNWMLATGSSDCKCRIFCAAIRGIDGSPAAAKGARFGEPLMEIDVASGWIHGLAWSPSFASLAVAAHDACVHVVDVADGVATGGEPKCATVRLRHLPQAAVCFLDEDTIVAVGHHPHPLLFSRGPSGWALKGEVKKGSNDGAGGAKTKVCALDAKAFAVTGVSPTIDLYSM